MKRFEGYTKGVNLGGWLSQCDHTEERYSTFITEEDIKAKFEDGVLKLTVPKREAPKVPEKKTILIEG